MKRKKTNKRKQKLFFSSSKTKCLGRIYTWQTDTHTHIHTNDRFCFFDRSFVNFVFNCNAAINRKNERKREEKKEQKLEKCQRL
ncbi:hypothetical protein DOY81_000242 [Sarcophaga bullata]|nr:hypothetical protein DOY81_000242 [Sarcophaga bullata]